MITHRIFLSTVTNEFKSCRVRLGDDLRSPSVLPLHQERDVENQASGHSTLIKLDDLIKDCHSVIHLIGLQTSTDGRVAATENVDDLLTRYPELSATIGLTEAELRDASIRYSNKCETELLLGSIDNALQSSEKAIFLADQLEDLLQQLARRTDLAEAQHYFGDRIKALHNFKEAEDLQAQRRPDSPLLNSLGGFRYCDFLLTPVESLLWNSYLKISSPRISIEEATTVCAEVEKRSRINLSQSANISLLAKALDHIVLGRSLLYPAVLYNSTSKEAISSISQGLGMLKNSNFLNHLPKGLLAAALYYHAVVGDAATASVLLEEAQQIAERGPMPLYLADVHLYRSRLFRDKAELHRARDLIEKHGYWRRKEELEDAEAAAMNW